MKTFLSIIVSHRRAICITLLGIALWAGLSAGPTFEGPALGPPAIIAFSFGLLLALLVLSGASFLVHVSEQYF